MLIRRTSGRRSYASKLDYVKRTMPEVPDSNGWAYFVITVWAWVGSGPPRVVSVEEAEARIRDLDGEGNPALDVLIPWLWKQQRDIDKRALERIRKQRTASAAREQRQVHRVQRAGQRPHPQVRDLIIDWIIGTRPNLMGMSVAQARTAAEEWHATALMADATKTFKALGKSAWRDRETGYWAWRADPGGADKKLVQAIGRALGHCYQQEPFSTTYPATGLDILLDASDKPRVGIGWRDGIAREVRSTQNAPPSRQPDVQAVVNYLTHVLGSPWDEYGLPDWTVLSRWGAGLGALRALDQKRFDGEVLFADDDGEIPSGLLGLDITCASASEATDLANRFIRHATDKKVFVPFVHRNDGTDHEYGREVVILGGDWLDTGSVQEGAILDVALDFRNLSDAELRRMGLPGDDGTHYYYVYGPTFRGQD